MTLDSDPRSGTLQKFCPDFIDQPVAVRPGDGVLTVAKLDHVRHRSRRQHHGETFSLKDKRQAGLLAAPGRR
jgi:hypothetical protein